MPTSFRGSRLKLLLVLSTVLTVTPLAAQEPGRLVGRVVDAEQGSPISGAQLEVVGTAITAISALDGRYALQAVPAGPVSIRVRMIGSRSSAFSTGAAASPTSTPTVTRSSSHQ